MSMQLCPSQGGSSQLTSDHENNPLADCGSASVVKKIGRLHINTAFHQIKEQGFNSGLLDQMKSAIYEEMGKETSIRLDHALSIVGGIEHPKLQPQLRSLVLEQLIKEEL